MHGNPKLKQAVRREAGCGHPSLLLQDLEGTRAQLRKVPSLITISEVTLLDERGGHWKSDSGTSSAFNPS